jgi:hypothetical protein
MHRSLTAALAAALGFVLSLAVPSPSLAWPAGPSAIEEARARLARHDPRDAVEVLESALPGADANLRPALLDQLRDAYAAAIVKAEAEGHKLEADGYRDNLEILNRKPRATTKAPQPVERPRVDVATKPAAVTPLEAVDPAEIPLAPVAPLPEPRPLPPAPAVSKAPATVKADAIPLPQVEPRATTPPVARQEPTDQVGAALRAADVAFLAAKYDEAGKLYGALDRARALPAERRSHWAYCRAVEVVRRINAKPTSAKEWASIHAEVQVIHALSPSKWFGEYLRNLVAERTRDPDVKKVVVRGSSPEEVARPPARAPVPVSQMAWSAQPIETANFQVIHVEKDRALAQSVAQAAESARDVQVRRWGATVVSGTWTPKCEVVLFPTARDFSRETLQPADSPGFSTMGMNGGRIVLRRVHLRADHPNLVKAILPHEVTHVVLADLFPHQQIPRWADEGMAVLAEPHSEQAVRAADLEEPLKTGRVFRVGDLMAMDYPDPKYWSLYYAQSVSLTRFLVESGSPSQFVRFVQESQRLGGFDPALRQVYSISGFDDLHSRWLAYAREKTSTITASTDSEKGPSTPKR